MGVLLVGISERTAPGEIDPNIIGSHPVRRRGRQIRIALKNDEIVIDAAVSALKSLPGDRSIESLD